VPGFFGGKVGGGAVPSALSWLIPAGEQSAGLFVWAAVIE